jgi:hypothetical protein
MKTRNYVGLALASLSFVLAAHAQVVGYVNDPANNSGNFSAAVGPSNITTYTFNTLATGALDPDAYAGITFSGNIDQVVYSAGPDDGNNESAPLNSGEGPHPISNVLESGVYNDSLTVDFSTAVEGAGIFVIDAFNIDGTNTTISAYDTSDVLLGTFALPNDNFQNNNEVFMGVSSSTDDIGSIVITHTGSSTGDHIALDNLEVAGGSPSVPDGGSTLTLLGGTIALVGALRRRFVK